MTQPCGAQTDREWWGGREAGELGERHDANAADGGVVAVAAGHEEGYKECVRQFCIPSD